MNNARDYLKKIIVDKNGKEWDKCGTTASKENILREINWIAPIMENYARGQVKNLTCVGGSSTKILNGYVGMNSNEFDIENMTFHKNKKRAKGYWGNKQDIVKVEVKFFL